MPRGERGGHLVEVVEAAEEAQVVARRARILRGDQIDDPRHRLLAIAIARRHIGDRAHLQLLRRERRRDIDTHARRGQAERVAVEMRGRERRGKERDGMRARETRLQMRRGNHVAQAEHGAWRARTEAGLKRDVEDRMRVEALGDPHEMHRVEIEARRFRRERVGMLGDEIRHLRDRVLQRGDEARRQRRVRRIIGGLRRSAVPSSFARRTPASFSAVVARCGASRRMRPDRASPNTCRARVRRDCAPRRRARSPASGSLRQARRAWRSCRSSSCSRRRSRRSSATFPGSGNTGRPRARARLRASAALSRRAAWSAAARAAGKRS